MKYLYGPVNSRRLGQSLGIDLFPRKVCNFNCVYCEAGLTDELTDETKEWVPLEGVQQEIEDWIREHGEPDSLTMAGRGEPTLYQPIDRLISWIRSRFSSRIVVITNSGALARSEVRQRILGADVVMPSLDSAREGSFRAINRPVENLQVEEVVDGLVRLRSEFTGEMWLEIFLAAGINDSRKDLEAMQKAVQQIKPDRIQLNSLDRRAPEEGIFPPSRDHMALWASSFEPFPVDLLGRNQA